MGQTKQTSAQLLQSAQQARLMAAKSPFEADRQRFIKLAEDYERRAAAVSVSDVATEPGNR